MIFSGKECAQKIKNALKEEFSNLPKKPRLDIVYAGDDPAIESFMKIKIRAGEDVGTETIVHRFSSTISQDELLAEIKKIAEDSASNGMIVQLPLPKGIDAKTILNAVPPEKDPDMLSDASWELFVSGKTENVPPVARAMMKILHENNIPISGKNVAILGRGILVGKPVRISIEREGGIVTGLNSTTGDPAPHLLKADIILSGVGKPHLIKPEMIREGSVIVDGGTSELDGKIAGDADPSCADKCSLFTPVPGGVGPVMVAMLFQNLATLMREQEKISS